jgi:phytoene synthase
VYALYAFCREADDAIDGGSDPFIGLSLFERRLEQRVLWTRVPPRVRSTVPWRGWCRTYGLPRELLEALLQGFAWDAQSRSYKDLAGLYGYGVRVAGSVGIMMALLMGVRDAGHARARRRSRRRHAADQYRPRRRRGRGATGACTCPCAGCARRT